MSELKKWTDAETAALLLAIVDSHISGAIKWPTVKLPEGRTVIACIRKLDKLRASIKDVKTVEGGSPAKSRARKSKTADADAGARDDEEATSSKPEDGTAIKEEDDGQQDAKENPKKRKTTAPATKPRAKKLKPNAVEEIEANH